MLVRSTKQQLLIAAALFALLILTRGHHFPTVKQVLPSASWAVFFLAGIYLRPAWALAGLLGAAALIDAAAIAWAGVSDYCVSPAYVGLIPAYGALWLAGRWYAHRHVFAPETLLPLAGALLAGVVACELISSGSFYFYSGRFAEPTLVEFGRRLVVYGSYYLQATAFWVGLAVLIHIALGTASRGLRPTGRAA